jgi:hypothetical protein
VIRIQIQLSEQQAELLRRRAISEQRSMADLVRESVAEYLARRPQVERGDLERHAMELAGRFRSAAPELASGHDRHLAEAFDE